MQRYRGLTWDHPRGRIWLEAASVLWRERGIDVVWEVQPLEGFEAHPIDELCERYDLVVLDHPHLGDALRTDSLQPLEAVLGECSPALAGSYVGPSLDSYRLGGCTWALPIDAATQVSARDPRMVAHAPVTWEEVERLAADLPVALSLAGPHALLSLFSVASALGAPPIDRAGSPWLDEGTVLDGLDVLRSVHARARREYLELNPIALLERVGSDDPLAYVPLVYGYVNYASPSRPVPVGFGDAPRISAGGIPGSTIGGTGVAISARASVTDALRDYLHWLVDPATQRRFVPEFAGQPSAAGAWEDADTDRSSGRFYSATRSTIEASTVRPRYPGFPDAQQRGSAIVRSALAAELDPREAASRLTALAAESRGIAPEGHPL